MARRTVAEQMVPGFKVVRRLGIRLEWDPHDEAVELEVIRAVMEERARPARGWITGMMVFTHVEEAMKVRERVMTNRVATTVGKET